MQYFVTLISIVFFPSFLLAYIGPGMAGGLVISILGIIVAIVVSIIGILYFPLKRFFKKKKK